MLGHVMTPQAEIVPLTDEEAAQLLYDCRRNPRRHALVSRLIAEIKHLRKAVRERERLLDRAAEALLRANR